mmetsp:Transcript_61786/g.144938  ORF Transcript_61786/g.144938 Transcript_61786/m.144938 type:complete len:225 (-) Transcript_61786:363-1037(-)
MLRQKQAINLQGGKVRLGPHDDHATLILGRSGAGKATFPVSILEEVPAYQCGIRLHTLPGDRKDESQDAARGCSALHVQRRTARHRGVEQPLCPLGRRVRTPKRALGVLQARQVFLGVSIPPSKSGACGEQRQEAQRRSHFKDSPPTGAEGPSRTRGSSAEARRNQQQCNGQPPESILRMPRGGEQPGCQSLPAGSIGGRTVLLKSAREALLNSECGMDQVVAS